MEEYTHIWMCTVCGRKDKACWPGERFFKNVELCETCNRRTERRVYPIDQPGRHPEVSWF